MSCLEVFFSKYYFRHIKILYWFKCSSGHQSFFNIRFSNRKSQRQQKLAKKVTNFTIHFRSKVSHEPQLTWRWKQDAPLTQPKLFLTLKFFSKHVSVLCQKKHLHCITSWRPGKRVVMFYLVGGAGGRGWFGWIGVTQNDFLKVTRCLGLVKCFTISYLIEIFRNSSIFQHLKTRIYSNKTLKLSRQLRLQG